MANSAVRQLIGKQFLGKGQTKSKGKAFSNALAAAMSPANILKERGTIPPSNPKPGKK